MKKIFSISIAVLLFTTAITAQTSNRALQFNINKSGLAINGYDPVSYFSAGKAVEGEKEITYTTKGITYRFSSVKNQQSFITDPAEYEPRYGGWCAYAMGTSGEKVSVDPETFKIINGNL